jgi:hypothetical protein
LHRLTKPLTHCQRDNKKIKFMKRIFCLLFLITSISSCVIVDDSRNNIIPQAALPGIWKLNGYASSNYKIELTQNGYLYWFNYNDDFNRVQEFDIDYNPTYNTLRLYYPNGTQVIHQITILRQANGRLYFDFQIKGYDANGHPITNTDTYYQM